MGNVKGTMEGEVDCKFMEQQYPSSCRYLKLWKRKYGFSGKLSVPQCQMLVNKLKEKDKNKGRKQDRPKTSTAKVWLAEAHKRKSGEEKGGGQINLSQRRHLRLPFLVLLPRYSLRSLISAPYEWSKRMGGPM